MAPLSRACALPSCRLAVLAVLPLLAVALALGALALAPTAAQARGGVHKRHTRNLLGSKALLVGQLAVTGGRHGLLHGPEGGPPALGRGVSAFYEREVLQDWLELELAVGMISEHGRVRLPLDLLLKKPFHLGERVTPYIALGPAIEFFSDGGAPLPGLTGTTGFYLWFSRDLGIDLEADYTVHFLRPGIEHVVTLGLGPVLHF